MPSSALIHAGFRNARKTEEAQPAVAGREGVRAIEIDLVRGHYHAEIQSSDGRVGAGEIKADAESIGREIWFSSERHGDDGEQSGSPQRIRQHLRQLSRRQLR